MFRKNYMPAVKLKKDVVTNRWYAEQSLAFGVKAYFATSCSEENTYNWYGDPTYYNNIADLVKDLYLWAAQECLKDVREFHARHNAICF